MRKIKCLLVLPRYPTELEKAIERHLGSLKAAEGTTERDKSHPSSIWTMELVSLALTGVKSQVTL